MNKHVYELLAIFEDELKCHREIRYRNYKNIDVSSHVRLEQDKDIINYALAVHHLFIGQPRYLVSSDLVNWQLRETYRLINTALASSSPSIDPLRAKLLVGPFKSEVQHLSSIEPHDGIPQ